MERTCAVLCVYVDYGNGRFFGSGYALDLSGPGPGVFAIGADEGRCGEALLLCHEIRACSWKYLRISGAF